MQQLHMIYKVSITACDETIWEMFLFIELFWAKDVQIY